MIGASLAVIVFLWVAMNVSIFKSEKLIESSWMPENSKFTLSSMPFSIERIVYYISLPNPVFSNDDLIDEHLKVKPIYKEAFDSVPIALQVFYGQGENKKIVAELLRHRFDIPYLDSLLGEELISDETHEYIRRYKFGHGSTREMLKKEVLLKIKNQAIDK